MRKTILTVAGGLWLLGLGATAGAGEFEGIITMRETSEGTVTEQRWYLKGDKWRLEELGDGADHSAMIVDARKQIMYNLQPGEKMYVEMSTARMAAQPAAKGAPPEDDIVLTKTGRKDHVAGHDCELYTATDKSDGSVSEVCVARGIGHVSMFETMSSWTGDAQAGGNWGKDLFKDGGFPIKSIERNAAGKEESRSEAVSIERKRLDDALFTPPPGYTKHDMDEMLREMRSPADR